jgi:hypothetical protein
LPGEGIANLRLPQENVFKARFLDLSLLKSAIVSANLGHNVRRTALVACLLLTQLQLLWLAAFHWRENQFPTINCALTLLDGGKQASPASHGKTPCAVCQIVRQNAVRPGIIAPVPQPFSACSFLPLAPLQGFHSFRPHVANGRAPPLA